MATEEQVAASYFKAPVEKKPDADNMKKTLFSDYRPGEPLNIRVKPDCIKVDDSKEEEEEEV